MRFLVEVIRYHSAAHRSEHEAESWDAVKRYLDGLAVIPSSVHISVVRDQPIEAKPEPEPKA